MNSHYHIDNPTLYTSGYLVANPKGYTKHYYAGSERISSAIGLGGLANINDPLSIEKYENWKIKAGSLKDEMSRTINECLKNEYDIKNSLEFLHGMEEAAAGTMDRYFYHPDHLGSSSWITDGKGYAIQHLHYLPFGEDWVDQRNASWNAPYTFSGKEKDVETGYSYFGARYYDSDLSIWLSVDPMSDKYPNITPYAYCANNPVILVDPDGRDIWKVNDNGEIVSRIKDKSKDAFYRVDADGKRIEGEENVITFKYGTIKERNHTVGTINGEKTLKIFEVKGDENASKTFNFLIGGNGSEKVEWGHVKIGNEGSGRNLIGTTNEKESSYMEGYALAFNYTIRESNHNHPGGPTIPSEADVNGAKSVSDKFKNATFNIFENPNKPVPYNKNSDYIKPIPGARVGKLTSGKKW